MKTQSPSNPTVVYCSPYYDPAVPSGANRRFDEVGKRLQDYYGSRFKLIVSRGKAPAWIKSDNLLEIDYQPKNAIARIRAWWQFKQILNKLPPSLVFNEFIPIPFASLRKHVHFQVVYDLRYFMSSKSLLYRLVFSRFLKRQWRNSEYIVTCSDFTRSELVRICGCDPERMVISYFGIDKSLLSQDQKSPQEKTIDLLFVGHFETRKNHAPFLRAVALIKEPLTVKLVGVDNGLKKMLQDLCVELKISDRVDFDTINDDARLWPIYRQSRLFVFPSIYEGFGIPLIESLALGTPVACSDIAIFREVGNGFVCYFNPTDPTSIAQTIEKTLASESSYSQAEVNSYLARFTWNQIADQFITDIEKIANNRS